MNVLGEGEKGRNYRHKKAALRRLSVTGWVSVEV